ncbi:uncharacterized protein LOC126672746 [Mercurialis annua]|uniref:uncharacterized protein LOC126672746 n=1 Tax=Mercurialis annua TaxID=3986 RepID=UPI00215E961D|nr:uncharacterized protein LOC126672746 [Mercurialis annua]
MKVRSIGVYAIRDNGDSDDTTKRNTRQKSLKESRTLVGNENRDLVCCFNVDVALMWNLTIKTTWDKYGSRNMNVDTRLNSAEDEILRLLHDFHSSGTFPSGLNTTFLILIPKVKRASDIKDYRPISLINGIFKMLSKIPIASEVIHISSRRKDPLFIIKLDFQKAFDSVSWQFITEIMQKMNFNDTWFSGLIASRKMFFMEKGVRQGDPLSPMLFVIAVEGFIIIIDSAKDLGLIEGVSIEGYHESLSLLQFADDTLLFLPNDLTMVSNLLRILRCFEVVFGLRINYAKSLIIGLNVSDQDIASATSILNCKIDKIPIAYLGFPLSRRSLTMSHFNPIVQIFSSHLALWKGVLSSMDRLMRNFLWSGLGSSRGICKVAWKDICLHLCFGGLNVPSLRLRNQSLLLKWVWKLFTCDKGSFWFLTTRASCNMNSWNDLINPNNLKLSHFWKGVRKYCVDNEDIWNLFSSNKRRLRLGESESFQLLKQKLPLAVFNIQQDKVFWSGRNEFTAAGFFKLHIPGDVHLQQDIFLLQVWKQKIPPRLQFFTWLLHRGRLASEDFLVRCRILDYEQQFCTHCAEIEPSAHIIFLCPLAWKFWSNFLTWIGIMAWIMLGDLASFYYQWMDLANSHYKNLWSAI